MNTFTDEGYARMRERLRDHRYVILEAVDTPEQSVIVVTATSSLLLHWVNHWRTRPLVVRLGRNYHLRVRWWRNWKIEAYVQRASPPAIWGWIPRA